MLCDDSDDEVFPYQSSYGNWSQDSGKLRGSHGDSNPWISSARAEEAPAKQYAPEGMPQTHRNHHTDASDDPVALVLMKNASKILTHMVQITSYLRNETDHDQKVIDAFFQSYQINQPRHCLLPAPYQALLGQLQQLDANFRQTVQVCLEAIGSRRTAYLAQVRKMQEASSTATRTAIQNERSRLLQKLNYYNTAQTAATDELQERLAAANATISSQASQLAKSEQQIRELTEHMDEQIARAVARNRDEAARAAAVLQDKLDGQLEQARGRMRDEALAAERKHGERLAEQTQAHEQMQRRLLDEQTALQVEIATLQTEARRHAEDMESLRSAQLRAANEQRDRYECQLQQQAIANTHAAVNLRDEQHAMQQALEKERTRLRTAYDAMAKEVREEVRGKAALEVETLRERLTADHRRRHAEQEAHYQEQIQKIKALHEQELSRHIRESDRLRRLLAQQPLQHTPAGVQPLSPARRTGTGSTSYGVPADGAPPPPPPDPLLLDEALHTASSARPYSIASNTRRVSGYLKELESYLHNQPVPPTAAAAAADSDGDDLFMDDFAFNLSRSSYI